MNKNTKLAESGGSWWSCDAIVRWPTCTRHLPSYLNTQNNQMINWSLSADEQEAAGQHEGKRWMFNESDYSHRTTQKQTGRTVSTQHHDNNQCSFITALLKCVCRFQPQCGCELWKCKMSRSAWISVSIEETSLKGKMIRYVLSSSVSWLLIKCLSAKRSENGKKLERSVTSSERLSHQKNDCSAADSFAVDQLINES